MLQSSSNAKMQLAISQRNHAFAKRQSQRMPSAKKRMRVFRFQRFFSRLFFLLFKSDICLQPLNACFLDYNKDNHNRFPFLGLKSYLKNEKKFMDLISIVFNAGRHIILDAKVGFFLPRCSKTLTAC